jgi:outer membrane protein assembly factor BamB
MSGPAGSRLARSRPVRQAALAGAGLLAVLLFAGCPRPPNKPEAPRGPAKGKRGVVLSCTTQTTDPAGGDVAYQFDWGDTRQSQWSAALPGGTAFADTHTYTEIGVFQVKARAKNSKGKVSAWSDPLDLQVDPGEGEARWWFGYAPDPEAPEDSAELSGCTFALGLDGNLYVSAGDMAALLCRNGLGNRRWEFIDPDYDEFATPAIMPDSTILAGTGGGTLYRVKPNGIKHDNWLTPPVFAADVLTPAALGADNIIYVQTDADSAYAIEPADGTKRWAFHRGGGSVPPVVGVDGTVYVCQEETLFALDPGTGQPKWRYSLPQNIASPPAIDPGRSAIYVADEIGELASVDLGDGSENWKANVGDQPSAPVIGPDGTVYVCGAGWLYAVEPLGGGASILYQPPLVGGASTPALSADDRIYFLVVPDKDRAGGLLTGSDSLYCVKYDGERRWACGLGSGSGADFLSAPKIDAEGYVYVCDGTRGWCVVGSGGPAQSPWPVFQHDFQNTGRARE